MSLASRSMIAGILPLATSVHYAVAAGLAGHDLVEAGRVHPMARDIDEDRIPQWLVEHLQSPSLRTLQRVAGLVQDTLDVVAEHQPAWIAVRVPSGMMRDTLAHKATYGLAAGAVWAALEQAWPRRVIPITDRDWQSLRGPKRAMQDQIAGLYAREYQRFDDPRGDVADAIALARWAIRLRG